MRTAQVSQTGTTPSEEVGKVLAAIAAHARQRQYEKTSGGSTEPLLSWERVAEFDAFKITVRCDYNVEER